MTATSNNRAHAPLASMGYQSGLDGIRALSVAIVILYHAGFDWMHGGFFGVEVFFVVSGFLITSLLLDERATSGRVSLGQFWLRRARRLLPALFTMLLAVTLWATFFGDDHLDQLGKDMLPAIFYASNWAQIVGDVPYFAPNDPPLLRHLWSLAVEEQWYILWPLVFVVLATVLRRRRPDELFLPLVALSLTAMLFSSVLTFSDDPLITLPVLGEVDRYNFLYLNTLSRASGLLLGAAFAFAWRPWRWGAAARRERRGLDVAGLGAMMLIVVVSATRSADVVQSDDLYRVWLPVVTVLSIVVVAVVVHPGARMTRAIFGWAPLVAVGRRSYGLYLWHWPIFVFADVKAEPGHFVPAMIVAIAASEACYRFVETPIRTGQWRAAWSRIGDGDLERRRRLTTALGASGVFLALAIGARLWSADAVDVARDDSVVEFTPASDTSDTTVQTPPGSDPATTSTTLASLPRSVVIVGDSQAHSLAINLPAGIEDTFAIVDGSVEGCGVLADGVVRSARSSFRRSLGECADATREWGRATADAGAEVALVVIGAWDVFDLEIDGTLVPFASAASDRLFLDGLQRGIDEIRATGAHVALLEVACMRPQDVSGAGVPALPERGDDARIAHLNELLQRAVAANPGGGVSFVRGPTEWCGDESISTDLAYRWDGVHVYKPGANLIYSSIADDLLAIPVG
jgi:peptidoglycan/LPS O-acetylase OafA/YrhL